MAFQTTRWSLVILAGGEGNEPAARAAIEELFTCYWKPLHVFMRRMGADEDEAMDLVQGLLTSILERPFFTRVDSDRGRFRNYLCGAARNFFANSKKSNDRHKTEPLNATDGGDGPGPQGNTVTNQTPEDDFNRVWAQTLLTRVVESVRSDYARRLSGPLFAALLPYVSYESDSPTLGALSESLGMNAGATRQALTRLRHRIRDKLREEVSCFTTDPLVDEELRFFRRVLEKKT